MAKKRAFDPADYLDDPEVRAAYITEALQTQDAEIITKAIGAVARACGMTHIAKEAGLSRENLYRSLGSKTNPEFATVMKVLTALDIELTARAKVA